MNAVTGKEWREKLSCRPQDYVVTPGQSWLDGFCVRKGIIRQFVAMPLGEGYAAEEQIPGNAPVQPPLTIPLGPDAKKVKEWIPGAGES